MGSYWSSEPPVKAVEEPLIKTVDKRPATMKVVYKAKQRVCSSDDLPAS